MRIVALCCYTVLIYQLLSAATQRTTFQVNVNLIALQWHGCDTAMSAVTQHNASVNGVFSQILKKMI